MRRRARRRSRPLHCRLPPAAWLAAERAAAIAAVQADAGREFDFTPASRGSVSALNGVQGLEVELDHAGLTIGSLRPASSWVSTLSWASIRRGSIRQTVPPAAAGPVVVRNRVSLQRGLHEEWYVNGPLGVEQGFTLVERLQGGGTPVVIEIEVSGDLEPALAADGARLHTPSGRTVLRYTELFAHDAAGAELPSWMHVAGSVIELHVDDLGASYPITVDPLAWAEQAKLVASDGEESDKFGYTPSV